MSLHKNYYGLKRTTDGVLLWCWVIIMMISISLKPALMHVDYKSCILLSVTDKYTVSSLLPSMLATHHSRCCWKAFAFHIACWSMHNKQAMQLLMFMFLLLKRSGGTKIIQLYHPRVKRTPDLFTIKVWVMTVTTNKQTVWIGWC